MVLSRQGLLRRVAKTLVIAAATLLPAPAFALMPWSGDGCCSALYAPGLRVAECDFRDYHETAHVISATTANISVAPVAHDASGYDWHGQSACGPTDWDCSSNYCESTPSVAAAFAAVGRLCPATPAGLFSWDRISELTAALPDPAELRAQQSEAAASSARAGLNATVRAAAGELSGALDNAGRQLLGAAAALERVASPAPDEAARANETARRTFGPQPSMHPYGYLGL
jgi:hypothetical protein